MLRVVTKRGATVVEIPEVKMITLWQSLKTVNHTLSSRIPIFLENSNLLRNVTLLQTSLIIVKFVICEVYFVSGVNFSYYKCYWS